LIASHLLLVLLACCRNYY